MIHIYIFSIFCCFYDKLYIFTDVCFILYNHVVVYNSYYMKYKNSDTRDIFMNIYPQCNHIY